MNRVVLIAAVLLSLVVLVLLYGALMAVDVYLLRKYAQAGPVDESVNALGAY